MGLARWEFGKTSGRVHRMLIRRKGHSSEEACSVKAFRSVDITGVEVELGAGRRIGIVSCGQEREV